jgi:DNA-binding Lrp family transcriptional regulator
MQMEGYSMPRIAKSASGRASDGSRVLDQIDQQILECVVRDAKVTVDQLAEELSLTASAIQKRLTALFDGRYIERVIAVRDWAGAGFPFRYRVDVQVNMRELKAGRGGLLDDQQRVDSQKKLGIYIAEIVPKQFRGRIVIEDVAILLGRADLSVTVRVRDAQTILDFVTDGLRMLGGVEQTVTSFESWAYDE